MNRNQAEPDARKYSTCHAQYVAQSCITQTPGTRVRRTRFVIYVDLGKKIHTKYIFTFTMGSRRS